MNDFLTAALWDATRSQPLAFGKEGERSLAQFRADVAAVRHQITQHFADAHCLLLVCPNDRYAFAVGLLSAWTLGVRVALPPNTRPQTLRDIFDAAQADGFLHDMDLQEGVDIRSWFADAPSRTAPAPEALDVGSFHAWRTDEVIATLFSSGTSSGTPQAAPKTVSQLLGEAQMLAQTLFPAGARVISTVEPTHIYGLLYSVLAPLYAGGSFSRDTPFFPESVARDVRAAHAEVLVSVPAHLATFRGVDVGDFASIQRLLSSTAPLLPEVAEAIYARFDLNITEVLGSSETGGMAVREFPSTSAWTPLPTVDLRADDEGRLWVDSPYLSHALERPYKSQEYVEFQGDSFIHKGRFDRVVKLGGRRVSLPDMEACILRLEGVEDAALLVESTRDLHGNRLHLAVVDPRGDRARVLKHLVRYFERSTLPRRIVFLEALPREANGKLQRARLWAAMQQNSTPRPHVSHLALQPLSPDAPLVEMNEMRYRMDIPKNYRWFKGHFDGHPLMAAAVQMHEIVTPALQHRLGEGRIAHILRMKFSKEIKPGDQLEVRVQKRDDCVSFSIWRENVCCTSGRLVWEGHA